MLDSKDLLARNWLVRNCPTRKPRATVGLRRLKGNRMKAAIVDHILGFIDRNEREERVIQTAGLTNDTTSSLECR